VNVFFDDKIIIPLSAPAPWATVIDEFNGDNFDHSGKGFIGGAYIAGMVTEAANRDDLYASRTRLGMEWKHAAQKTIYGRSI